MVGAAELNIDVNHAIQSVKIFGGQGAQGEAQMIDPIKTRADMRAGMPVTGAAALVATQVDQGDAEARTKQADALAANEGIDDILAKQARRQKLTTTEELRLKDYQLKVRELQLKEKEIALREYDVKIRGAESTAAEAKALAEKQGAEFSSRMIESMNGRGGGLFGSNLGETIGTLIRPNR